MKKVLSMLIILGFILIASIMSIFFVYNRPTGQSPTQDFRFVLAHGSSTRVVARDLKNANIIRSDLFFRLLTRVMNLDSRMQAGPYLIPANSSTLEILRMISSGKIELMRVTVPEGFTLRKVANVLESAGVVESKEFIAAAKNPDLLLQLGIQSETAEGFLFPDTYRFPAAYPADQVLKTMVQAFFKNLEKISPYYMQMPWSEFYDHLIMASIVEKEHRVASEAATIASVFYNRLTRGIALESCASVVYVITEIQGKPHPNRLFYKDLEVKSPYNAYKNKGLPPGPISNPGPTSLNAAFNPAQTDYLFFVVEDARMGTHLFSSNLADHEAGRQRYVETYFPK
ncbi:MAG: endolytic transglycosylase MltG [Spirochaetia bacterium]